MMYYYIKGKPVRVGLNYVVIDVHGVGYMITTSSNSIAMIRGNEKEITMYTYFSVREDAQELYGFISEEEREMFETLIGISGVGPKAAVSILSAATVNEFAAAVLTDNVKVITKAQGIGPKLAKRIILELHDKLQKYGFTADTENVPSVSADAGSRSDAVSALVALGYSNDDASKAVAAVEGDMTAEELIKKALIRLM